MVDPVRQEVIALAHTVVVKVGTNVLTRPDGTLSWAYHRSLGRANAGARRRGHCIAV